jgi:hypothetical protein
MVRRITDKRRFGDYVKQERISSIYVDRKVGDSLTMSCEEVMENSHFHGPVIGEEVTKEVLETWLGRDV